MNPSTTLTLDQWQILFHETMAALLRARDAVSRKFGFWSVMKGLWTCSHDLKALRTSLKAISELPDGMLSDDFIHSQIPQLRKLRGSIEDLMDMAISNGLTNRSLTSSPLTSIRMHGEYIADYLDALELSIDPEVLKAIDEGRAQIDRGECEIMERLF
jgi:hypothetical protein